MAVGVTPQHDVDLLREVQRLSQDEGVNLAGIKRIIELFHQVEALRVACSRWRGSGDAFGHGRDRQVPKSTALVAAPAARGHA